MTTSINTLVSSALNAASSYGDSIKGLRAALMGQTSPEVRAAILAPVAAYYKVSVVAKERGAGFTLDVNAKQYEAAKKAIQRLSKDIAGKVAAQPDAIEVPANILAAARTLIKLCAEYEGANKLVSTALAQARAA